MQAVRTCRSRAVSRAKAGVLGAVPGAVPGAAPCAGAAATSCWFLSCRGFSGLGLEKSPSASRRQTDRQTERAPSCIATEVTDDIRISHPPANLDGITSGRPTRRPRLPIHHTALRPPTDVMFALSEESKVRTADLDTCNSRTCILDQY